MIPRTPHSIFKFAGFAWALLGGMAGCVKLDGFMFDGTPAELSDYDFTLPELDGIDPARIESHLIPSGDAEIHIIEVARDETKLDPRLDPNDRLTILFSHGNRENMLNYWYRAGYFEDMGFNVVFYDYRGYGASTGEATEDHTYEDAEAVLAYVRSRPQYGRIISYAYSMGGGPGIWICSNEREAPPPEVCMSESSYAKIGRLIDEGLGWDMPPEWYVEVEYDNIGRIATVDVPYYLMHGREDVRVRVEHGREMWAVVQPNNPRNRYYEDPRAGHRNFATPSWDGEYEPKKYSHPRELPPELLTDYHAYKKRLNDFLVQALAP